MRDRGRLSKWRLLTAVLFKYAPPLPEYRERGKEELPRSINTAVK